MSMEKLNVLIAVAHPDDAEGRAGGTAALFRQHGCRVKFLCMTNGDTGHYSIGGVELARRRQREAEQAAAVIGAECRVLDIHNNELEPSLHYRKMLIEEIRKFQTDLIITHRIYDYHPDHRYTSHLVRDAISSANIPNVCPLTPELAKNPATVYAHDAFQKPVAFDPEVVVNVEPVIEIKLKMWHCHTSQMYEWLPYSGGRLDQVPSSERARKEWLATWRLNEQIAVADKYRDKLRRFYGEEAGAEIKYAEAFEFSEYGTRLHKDNYRSYFPFLPEIN